VKRPNAYRTVGGRLARQRLGAESARHGQAVPDEPSRPSGGPTGALAAAAEAIPSCLCRSIGAARPTRVSLPHPRTGRGDRFAPEAWDAPQHAAQICPKPYPSFQACLVARAPSGRTSGRTRGRLVRSGPAGQRGSPRLPASGGVCPSGPGLPGLVSARQRRPAVRAPHGRFRSPRGVSRSPAGRVERSGPLDECAQPALPHEVNGAAETGLAAPTWMPPVSIAIRPQWVGYYLLHAPVWGERAGLVTAPGGVGASAPVTPRAAPAAGPRSGRTCG
jgi:hypothetical protein